MNNGIEIRWHGRGGQGAKTAALLLADVAFKTGQVHLLRLTIELVKTRSVFILIYTHLIMWLL